MLILMDVHRTKREIRALRRERDRALDALEAVCAELAKADDLPLSPAVLDAIVVLGELRPAVLGVV